MKTNHESSSLSVSEAGAKGGNITLNRHGIEHFKQIGKIGGQRTIRLYGSGQMSHWGALGGRPRKQPLNSEHKNMEGENRNKKEASGGQPLVSLPPPNYKRTT